MEDGTEGPEKICMENNHEEVRANAVTDMGDENPLCFTIATIYEDPDYLSEMSEPICMYRCSWEDDCNYYMEFDEDDFKEMEYEVCAGMDVTLEEGCFDMGFCDSTTEARDWIFWMWPYDATNEDEAQMFEEWGMYYWIPTVYTNPPGCQLEYEVKSQKNVEWEWDPWCSDEGMEDVVCQSIQFWPTLLDEGSRSEIYFKIRVSVSGTSTYKDFYQFFAWDWEYYNQVQNWDYNGDEEFECPPDFPECMDDWYAAYYDFYYMMDDFGMPTYEEIEEFLLSLDPAIDTLTMDAYTYLTEEFAPEDDPSTIDTLMGLLMVDMSRA